MLFRPLCLLALSATAFAQFGPVPPILVPSQGDVWRVGELRTVEWGIQGISLTNETGDPILGFVVLQYYSGDPLNPVILGGQRLASDFPISQTMVNIIVPEVQTRNDYSIFLNAADNGVSWSGAIQIFNPDDPQGTGSPPTSLSVSSAPPISVTVVLPTPSDNSQSSSATSNSLPTSVAASTSSSPDTSPSQSTSPNSACPLSRHDLLTRAGLVLAPALAVVFAMM
ncbi:hypothetical protein C8Q76DRAFT_637241 [Earliella scabrosa]|nr:hypothetical protein C8Q76DRAFT_637241 [Earliella scabrosa]